MTADSGVPTIPVGATVKWDPDICGTFPQNVPGVTPAYWGEVRGYATFHTTGDEQLKYCYVLTIPNVVHPQLVWVGYCEEIDNNKGDTPT